MVVIMILVAFVLGFAVANRNQVVTALRPEPTLTPTQSPASHATRARLFERDREFAKAIEAWEAALALDPTNPTYTIALMNLLVKTGEAERAIVLGQRVLEAEAGSDGLWTALALAYLTNGDRRANMGLRQGEDYGLAVEAARSAITVNPTNALAYAYMAGGMMRQGVDFVPQAQAMIENGLALLPENPSTQRERETVGTVRYYAAEALIYQGYYDSARQQLEAAIANNPDLVDAYLSLARIYYFFSNEQQRAIITLKDAINRDPTNANLYDALAYFYMIVGAYPEAEQNAKLAVRYDNDMVRAHARLGHAYYKQFNYPNAITELEIAARGYGNPSPETAIYFAMLGLAYYYENAANCATAQPLFESALAVSAKGSPAELSALEGMALCRQVRINQP